MNRKLKMDRKRKTRLIAMGIRSGKEIVQPCDELDGLCSPQSFPGLAISATLHRQRHETTLDRQKWRLAYVVHEEDTSCSSTPLMYSK